MKIEIIAEKKGREILYDRELFRAALQRFKDGTLLITLSTQSVLPEFKKRTNAENRYYFGIIVKHAAACFSEAEGRTYSPEQAHERLKLELNYGYVEMTNKITGETKTEKVPLTTANLSTVEFENYLSECRVFLNEWFGVYVPMPNENVNEYL